MVPLRYTDPIRISPCEIIQAVRRCREIFLVSGEKIDVEIENGGATEAQSRKDSPRVAGKFRKTEED